jgi:hypothetical protein
MATYGEARNRRDRRASGPRAGDGQGLLPSCGPRHSLVGDTWERSGSPARFCFARQKNISSTPTGAHCEGRMVRRATTIASSPNSKRPVGARCANVASTRSAARRRRSRCRFRTHAASRAAPPCVHARTRMQGSPRARGCVSQIANSESVASGLLQHSGQIRHNARLASRTDFPTSVPTRGLTIVKALQMARFGLQVWRSRKPVWAFRSIGGSNPPLSVIPPAESSAGGTRST